MKLFSALCRMPKHSQKRSFSSIVLGIVVIIACSAFSITPCRAQYEPLYGPQTYQDELYGIASAPVNVTLVKVGSTIRTPTISYSITGTDTDGWLIQGGSAFVQKFDPTLISSEVTITGAGASGSITHTLRGRQGNSYVWDITYGGKTVAGTYVDTWEVANDRPVGNILLDPSVQVSQQIIINAPNP